MMKKIFLLTLTFMAIASCSSDSEIIPDDTSGDIEGVWMLKAEYEGQRLPLSKCRLMESIVFEGNSVVMVKAAEIGTSGCNLNTIHGTFAKTGISLSIETANQNTKYKIKELTKTKLYLIPENSIKSYEYERAE